MLLRVVLFGLLAILAAVTGGVGLPTLSLYTTARIRRIRWVGLGLLGMLVATAMRSGGNEYHIVVVLACASVGWWLRSRTGPQALGVAALSTAMGALLLIRPWGISHGMQLSMGLLEAVVTAVMVGLHDELSKASHLTTGDPRAAPGPPRWRDGLFGLFLIYPVVGGVIYLGGMLLGASVPSPMSAAGGGSGPHQYGVYGGLNALQALFIISIMGPPALTAILMLIIAGIGVVAGLKGFPALRRWRAN